MNPLCYTLVMSIANSASSPPEHIQNLLKSRVLHQMHEQNLSLNFDDSGCHVLASYNYESDALHIEAADPKLDLKFPYSDILEGKKLDLSSVQEATEKASLTAMQNAEHPAVVSEDTGQSKFMKWLPWIAGSLALGFGGWYLYNQSHDSHSTPSNADVRRF